MEKRNFINLISLGFILLALSCNRKENSSKPSMINNDQFIIEDTTLQRVIDQYTGLFKFKPENCLLRVFIENEPLKKSFILMNSYSADDLRIKPCTYYSNYKGYDVIIYTGINNFIPHVDSIPNNLNRFLNQEPHTYSYFTYRYEYDQYENKDTFYEVETNLYMVNPKPITHLKYTE